MIYILKILDFALFMGIGFVIFRIIILLDNMYIRYKRKEWKRKNKKL